MSPLMLTGTGSAVRPLILDTFIDPNGTNLTAHTISPTNTVGASWSVISGSYDIQGNIAHGNTAVTENEALADCGKLNATITAVGHSQDVNTRLGLLARTGASDADGWQFYWDTAGHIVQIFQNFGTLRASGALTYVANKDWNLTLAVNGSTITGTVTQADNPSNTVTVSYGSMSGGSSLTSTKVGIICYTNVAGSGIKSFQVTSP